MNKKSFCAALRAHVAKKKPSVTTAEATMWLDAVLEVLVESIQSKEDLKLTGYLSMKPHYVGPTNRRNPKTGETIKKPATYTVKMKPGNVLKSAASQLKK